ncbi:MAG TPA: hypothetical protein VM618_12780, partial [Acidimicrobiia bacterium]|nr:hypothetical protein [Acidimicrobiia bacterium]
MEPEPLTERYRRHVGDGAERRPPPLLAPVIAAVAALVAGWGVAEVGAAIVTENGSEVVAAFVAVAYGGGGLALLTIGQRAHGAAGATALAVSVPLALGFLFLTTGPVDPDEPTLVLALSTVLWGALHLSGPTRGRPLFLTLALAGAWLSVLLQVGLDVVIAFSTLGSPVFGVPGFSSDPNTATTGLVSLLFGTAYVGGGYLLHREGLAGTATPFAGVGSAALAVGALTAAVGRSAWVAGALF